jgi:predicted phage tail protein
MAEPGKGSDDPTGTGSGDPTNTGGASDDARTEGEKALQLQLDTMTSKYNDVNGRLNDTTSLLTKTHSEMKRARADASTANQKKKAAAEGEAATTEDLDKRIAAIKKEHEGEMTPLLADNKRFYGKLEKSEIHQALVNICTLQGALQPEFIASHLKGRVRLNKETLTVEVVDENGQKDYHGSADMTLEKLVSNFLGKPENSNLVSAKSKPGSGGGPSGAGGSFSNGQPPKDSDEYNAWMKTDDGQAFYKKHLRR